jgi:hypothetical protein
MLHRLSACLIALALSSCAKVAPFERGTLGHRCMQVTTTPERQAARDHVLSVREAAAGGHGAQGGGCGCN